MSKSNLCRSWKKELFTKRRVWGRASGECQVRKWAGRMPDRVLRLDGDEVSWGL